MSAAVELRDPIRSSLFGSGPGRRALRTAVRWGGGGLLVAWVCFWAGLRLRSAGGSWHWFVTGSHALFDLGSPFGGLHLYHYYPQLQIGPVAFLVAAPALLLPWKTGVLVMVLLMAAAIAVIAAVLVCLVPRSRRATVVVPLLLLAPAWQDLAVRTAHLDDVLALVGVMLALLLVRLRHPMAAAVVLALAADSKPWALGFVTLLLAVPAAHRLRALAVWAGVVVIAWAPFLVADPRTVNAAGFRMATAAASALRALGFPDPTTPLWCRPVQLLLGIALGWLAWRRGRPAVIPFVVVATRLLFDPGVWNYYTAGLLVTAAVVDVSLAQRRPIPWCSLGAALLVLVPQYLPADLSLTATLAGQLRAGYLVVALVAVLAVPMRDLLSPPPDIRPIGKIRRAWTAQEHLR